LQSPDEALALAALLAIPGHEVDTRRFERCFNLDPGAARELYARSGALLLGSTPPFALPAARVAAISDEIIAALTAFHRAFPEAGGMTLRALKDKLSWQISAEAFLVLHRELADKRLVASGGTLVKLAGHAARFSPAEVSLWRKLLPRLVDRGALTFTARELATDSRTSEAAIKALLYRRRSNGEVWCITDKRFMLRKHVAALAASAAALAQDLGGKGFSAAQYRDAIGAGRNLVIQILEFFDSIGVTRRTGDLRKMRPDYELVVGSAAPYVPREAAVNTKDNFGAE
jgi:selenocysteine-specific elongation factor